MPSTPSAPGCALLARPGMPSSIERPYFAAAIGVIMTDIHPMAFGFAGVSGILELTGIAAWASWILRRLYGSRALQAWQAASGQAPLQQPTGATS